MSSGQMWWAKSDWVYLPPPGVTLTLPPQAITFSGAAITLPTTWPLLDPMPPWYFELRSQYFLNPPRMPATGEPFISMPKVTFGGGLAVSGGPPGKETGFASCNIRLRQSLWWDDEHVASSEVLWTVGHVIGTTVVWGKKVPGVPGVVLTPQKRDYGALFFNLDRTRTLIVTLTITITFDAYLGGIIAFAPSGFVVAIPDWLVYSLD
jgi:hypothetical protein